MDREDTSKLPTSCIIRKGTAMNLDFFIGCFSVGREAVGGVGTVVGPGSLIESLASLYFFRGLNVVTGITGNRVN